MLRLLPRSEKFFQLFGEQADVLHEAAGVLVEMLNAANGDIRSYHDKIRKLEHRGDTMTHDTITRLNQTFITPLDREDIHSLSSRLDDVLDLIDAVATRMVMYKIRDRREPAIELARVLQRATAELVAAVPHILTKREGILRHCQEINRLEHESDTISRNAIAQLFEVETDPITLIKWKELYEGLEEAVDKTDDAANVLETIILKGG